MANETAVTELIIDAGAALTAAQQYDAVLDQVTDASQKAATATDTAGRVDHHDRRGRRRQPYPDQPAGQGDRPVPRVDRRHLHRPAEAAGRHCSLAAAQQALIREVQADAISMEQYAAQTAAITLRQQELQAASAGLKDGTVDVASAMTTLQAPLQRTTAAARDQTVANRDLQRRGTGTERQARSRRRRPSGITLRRSRAPTICSLRRKSGRTSHTAALAAGEDRTGCIRTTSTGAWNDQFEVVHRSAGARPRDAERQLQASGRLGHDRASVAIWGTGDDRCVDQSARHWYGRIGSRLHRCRCRHRTGDRVAARGDTGARVDRRRLGG